MGVWRAFGFIGTATIVLGTAAIMTVIRFLISLRIASQDAIQAIQGRPMTRLWHMTVESYWAARAVTLSSVVLRLAISLQAGLAAAMFAALILETRGVRLARFPQMSISCAVNSGL